MPSASFYYFLIFVHSRAMASLESSLQLNRQCLMDFCLIWCHHLSTLSSVVYDVPQCSSWYPNPYCMFCQCIVHGGRLLGLCSNLGTSWWAPLYTGVHDGVDSLWKSKSCLVVCSSELQLLLTYYEMMVTFCRNLLPWSDWRSSKIVPLLVACFFHPVKCMRSCGLSCAGTL